MAISTSSLPAGEYTDSWHKNRVVIPHFFFEYAVPPSLAAGYRGNRSEVAFDVKRDDGSISPFGPAAREQVIATYFYGVVGDFADFDITVTISVLKFDGTKRSLASVGDLASYVREVLSEKYILKNGKEVDDLGGVTMSDISEFRVVVAKAADMYHVTQATLKTRAIVTLQPYQFYFLRLDDEMALLVRVLHYTPKRLTPQWHANAETMIAEMIARMKILPRPKAESEK